MATDGSRRATEALTAAVGILSEPARSVDLMCVIPKVSHREGFSHYKKLQRRANHALDAANDELTARGVSVRTVVCYGSPAGLLVGASASYGLTVIAASSRPAGLMSGLGPVASRLAEHALGTTLLMRELRSENGLRILAAIDGSEASYRAIERMKELVKLSDAEITLLHVVETPWLHIASDQEWMDLEESDPPTNDEEDLDLEAELESEFVGEFVGQADQILDKARNNLADLEVVNTCIRDGFPADVILAEADQGAYDLVVLGTTGSTDLKHRILGSVSSRVAWSAPCSVLLVGIPS
jgi:nucleotide-binding universal stress UspA family protein